MAALHLIPKRVQVAVVRDHIVRGLEPHCTRRLGRENGASLLERRAVAGLQAPDLQRFVAIDDEDPIDPRSVALLDEQGEGEDLIGAVGRRCPLLEGLEDGWVCQRFETRARSRVGEDELTQRAAIEAAVGTKISLAESLDDTGEERRSGGRDLACDDVGIDDGHAEGGKQARDGGFAAGDAAGQADAEGSC